MKKQGATYRLKGDNWKGIVTPSLDYGEARLGYLTLQAFCNDDRDKNCQKELEASIQKHLELAGAHIKKVHFSTIIFNPKGEPSDLEKGSGGYPLEPLPSEVKRVLPQYKSDIKKKGCAQMRFGKEFIASSYAVATEPAPLIILCDRRTFKGMYDYEHPYGQEPDHRIKYAQGDKLYWMHTGAFD